jgi:hypothetical protein
MLEFIRDGGFGMFPILFFGAVTLISAGRFAWKPQEPARPYLSAMTRSLVWFTMGAFAADVTTTLRAVAGGDFPGAERSLILMQGLAESTNALILGFAILALVHLLVAAGERRAGAP